MNLIEGDAIIRNNPHPAFERITKAGYTLAYFLESDGTFVEMELVVRCAGEQVASANFSDDGRTAYCQNLAVIEEHRRRGIATAMYVFVEKVLNRRLIDFWGQDPWQSPAAKALWVQKDRPRRDTWGDWRTPGSLGSAAGLPCA